MNFSENKVSNIIEFPADKVSPARARRIGNLTLELSSEDVISDNPYSSLEHTGYDTQPTKNPYEFAEPSFYIEGADAYESNVDY